MDHLAHKLAGFAFEAFVFGGRGDEIEEAREHLQNAIAGGSGGHLFGVDEGPRAQFLVAGKRNSETAPGIVLPECRLAHFQSAGRGHFCFHIRIQDLVVQESAARCAQIPDEEL